MKLSFSTKNWERESTTLAGFISLAREYRYGGIEIFDINNYDDELSAQNINRIYGRFYEYDISVSCIALKNKIIAGEGDNENAVEEFKKAASIAKKLGAQMISVRTEVGADDADAQKFIAKILPTAEAENVILLVTTSGIYADTARLRALLAGFASDNLGALWDVNLPYRKNGETAETTVKNLGAYIRHIHMRDSEEPDADGNIRYALSGEGTLPIDDIIRALRSVNYNDFMSLEWNPLWLEDISEAEIILPHFVGYMSRFDNLSRAAATLYKNKAGTGDFVWKKDLLIEKTFSQVLDTMVEHFPDAYAFKFTTLDYTRTYSEFREDVDDFARVLISLGVKPGHHVAVWATNIPQWYIAFWAVTKIGAVLVSMNTAYKIHEAEYLLSQSDTYLLISVDGYRDSDYSSIIGELCPELENTSADMPLHAKRLPFLRHIITVGFEKAGCLEWNEVMKRAETVGKAEVIRRAAAVNIHDVCNMQYTSGTTGFPKGVMLTHYNIVNNGKCIGDRMDLSTADRMMIQVPMFHCFGMVLAMTASMTHGATLCPLPYFSPKSALACINQEKITAFHGVPTMFIAMLEHPDFATTDFSYIRTGIMAGSPCPVAIMKDVVNKMNMREIVIVYGQTEASPGCTMSSTDDPIEVRVGTVGCAMPEIECKIVDPETGADLPDEVTGEFVARGYNIMKGYYKMPLATAAAIDKDGWLHTGDLACRNPDGNYRITGRLKDMIIRGGENIYPKEIEEFIYTHPKVKDVQVIGVPDAQYGEEIMACVILKDGESMTEEELKKYISTHMAKHKTPRYVSFMKSFPMNVAGKILKYKMREDAIEQFGLQKASKIVTA